MKSATPNPNMPLWSKVEIRKHSPLNPNFLPSFPGNYFRTSKWKWRYYILINTYTTKILLTIQLLVNYFNQSSISLARLFSFTMGDLRASTMVAQVNGGSDFLFHISNTSAKLIIGVHFCIMFSWCVGMFSWSPNTSHLSMARLATLLNKSFILGGLFSGSSKR